MSLSASAGVTATLVASGCTVLGVQFRANGSAWSPVDGSGTCA